MAERAGESVTGSDRIDASNLAHCPLKGFTAYTQGSDDISWRADIFQKTRTANGPGCRPLSA